MSWLVGFYFPTCCQKMPGRTKYLIEPARCLRIMDAKLPWTGNSTLVLRYDNLFCQNFGFCYFKLPCKVWSQPPHWSLIRHLGRSRNGSSVGSLVLWCQGDIEKRYSCPWLLLDWQWMFRYGVDSVGNKFYFPVSFWYRQGVILISLVDHEIAWCDLSRTIDYRRSLSLFGFLK